MVSQHDSVARRRLASLFPVLGPWTLATLSHGLVEQAVPAASVDYELSTIRRQRLATLAADLLNNRPNEVPQSVRRSLQAEAFSSVVYSQSLVGQAEGIVTGLASAGIQAVVFKGPAIACAYTRPSLRVFIDIDLIVQPAQFRRALKHFRTEGWSEFEQSRQPREYFQRWCRESVNLYHPTRGHVDLHHRPSPWRWGDRIGASNLLDGPDVVAFAGARLPCTSVAVNALVSALQLVTDHNAPGSKLLAWRDLSELGRAEPTAIAELANRTGLGGLLRALVSGMPRSIAPLELEELLDPKICDAKHLVMLLESAESGQFVRTHMARLPTMNAVAYGLGTLVPNRAFLNGRYPTENQKLLRWWRELRTTKQAELLV